MKKHCGTEYFSYEFLCEWIFFFLPHLAGILQSDSPVCIHYFVDESTSDAVASTCHAMPLSALKNGWLGNFAIDIVVKKQIDIIQSTRTVRSLINKLTVD